MKRIVFVHGWYGHPTDGWWPWLKSQLEDKGFEVIAPQMPDTENPKVQDWVRTVRDAVGKPNSETYLVGHSLGCITILKYLQQLYGDNLIGAAVLVAGFTRDLTFDGYNGALANFFDKPIDWHAVNEHCPKFWVISSDNDPTVSSDNHTRLVANLNGKESWEHSKKHMTGDDGIFELPSVLNAVKNLSKS